MASVKGLKGGAVFGQFTLKYPLLAIALGCLLYKKGLLQ